MNNMIKRVHSNFCLISNLNETADFYEKLGFDAVVEDDAVRIKLGDFTLCLMDESKVEIQNEVGDAPRGSGLYTYIEVENVDEYYDFVKNNGLVPSSKPKTWPWGKREFAIVDPDGYKLVFFSPVKTAKKDNTKINYYEY